MINHKTKCLLSLSLFWGTHTYAGSQVLTIDGNSRLEATISRDYLNRIAASNDRITQIFGDEATYAIQVDENKGQIFIKPSEANGLKPISLTIITESGQVQDLNLKPGDNGASTIVLKGIKSESTIAQKESKASAQYLELTLPLQEKLIRAMKMLVGGEFSVSEGGEDRKEIEGLTIYHKKSYQVGSYKGHQYEVTNITDALFDLDEKVLYQPGDMSLSLGRKVLSPSGSTVLWVIAR